MAVNLDQFLRPPLRVVALKDDDADSLFRSASGGAFPVLARPILKNNGVVFGAEMLPKGEVRHVGITSVEELPRLQGSKYVQSDTAGTFGECADALLAGKPVLYSGIPCQVFALRSNLVGRGFGEEETRKLLTVDLVCHGVTSQRLFSLYIEWLEGKVGAVPGSLHYEFRSKKRGWGLYYYYYYYASKKDGRTHDRFGQCEEDPYYMAFLEGQLYRRSCYKCRFARKERVGDFTIGDFWGIQREHPSFDCGDGASLVLVNSEKALAHFERCESGCTVEESTFEHASRENSNLLHPTIQKEESSELVDRVDEALRRGDGELIFGKLLKRPFDIKRSIKKVLPYPLFLFIKRILGRGDASAR